MNNNLLLAYLSALGQGAWRKFRRVFDELTINEPVESIYPTVKARQLSHLGHVEFDFERDLRWAISPPTLAWLPRQDGVVGVLCGYRTKNLISKLEAVVREYGGEVEICYQPEAPDAVLVRIPASHIGHTIAQNLGIHSEPDLATRLAYCLPSIEDYWHLCPSEPEPVGYKMQQFDPQSLEWRDVASSEKEGFYRYEYFYPEYRLKWNGNCIKTPKNVGCFLLLNKYKKHVLQYDDSKQTLTVPLSLKLPILFARSATLCSGFVPNFNPSQKQHTYSEVTPTVARYILSKLKQGSE